MNPTRNINEAARDPRPGDVYQCRDVSLVVVSREGEEIFWVKATNLGGRCTVERLKVWVNEDAWELIHRGQVTKETKETSE
jgi:hypothetical protein